jgi:hypothetical protein
MITVWLALVGTIIVSAILLVIRLLLARNKSRDIRALFTWLGVVTGINFVFSLGILYFSMPAITGPYWGWQWLFWPLFLGGLISIVLNSVLSTKRLFETLSRQRGRIFTVGGKVFSDSFVDTKPPDLRTLMADGAGRTGLIAIGLVLVLSIVGNSIIAIGTTWFDPNAKALASIANIQIASENTVLPPTNVDHIVLVTEGNAVFKGQQALGKNNLGSRYHFDENEYTLQSIKDHLYWIAPMIYNNIWANLGNYDTPGFVVIDAEDPNAESQLKLDYHLHYVPDALLNQDLVRHVYLSGYTYGNLEDPTLEIDDNWQPFFTISVTQPTRGFTGEVVKQILLVDPQNGDIKVYDPDKVPSWVDRIIPASMVTNYLTWWGLYHNAPWINFSGANQEKPGADPLLVYNDVNQPVWFVPMTSSAKSDNSSTGMVLFDTKKNEATVYPLTGLGIGDNVKSTFENYVGNVLKYKVNSIQLYSIYGEPTWVGIYVQPSSPGEIYQSVGLVSARHLNGGAIQVASTLDAALLKYQQWRSQQTGTTGTETKPINFEGKVTRIAPTNEGSTTQFYILVEGQSKIFVAPLALSPLLPLVQPGDTITGTYVDTGEDKVVLTAFNDLSIQLSKPSPTPGSLPSPTPTP